MRLRIGSYANSGEWDKIPAVLSPREQQILKVTKRPMLPPSRNGSMSPKAVLSKSPSMGGAMRNQRSRDQRITDHIQKRISREREKSSPLRIKAPSLGERRAFQTVLSPESSTISPRIKQYNAINVKSTQSQGTLRQYQNSMKNLKNYDKRTSPLRKKSSAREKPPKIRKEEQQVPERDSSRSRFIAARPVRTGGGYNIFYNREDDKLKLRIEALGIDNNALARRLELVKSELEQVRDEKAQNYQKYLECVGEVDATHKELDGEGEIDEQNKILKDQLESEKLSGKDTQKQIDQLGKEKRDAENDILSVEVEGHNYHLEAQEADLYIQKAEIGIEQLERDSIEAIRKSKYAQTELQKLTSQEAILQEVISGLEIQVKKQQNERNMLLGDIQGLTGDFSGIQNDLNGMHKNLNIDTRWRRKLVAIKIMANDIQNNQNRQLAESFKELKAYGDFDKECFTKLKAFSLVIHKLTQVTKSAVLIKWYANAFKPLETRQQNQNIVRKIARDRKLQKVFYGWRQQHQKRVNAYQKKTQSINKIWEKLGRYAHCEMKRAMTIWREGGSHQVQSTTKIRNMILRRYRFQLSKALLSWKNYSMELDQAVRVVILQREYSQKFYLSRVFSELRQQTIQIRKQRLIILGHCVKGWKNALAYKKHFLQTNLYAIQLGRVNRTFNLKAIFDAIVHNKETNKHAIMQSALRDDMDIALEEHRDAIAKHNEKTYTKGMKKSVGLVRDMFASRLIAHFRHWQEHTQTFKAHLNAKVKDRVFRMYRNYMLSYFNGWKKGTSVKKVRHKKKMMMVMEEQNQALEDESHAETQKAKVQAEAVCSIKEKKNTKLFKKYILRVQKNTLDRWRDKVESHRAGKLRSNQVLGKMRNRFCKEAFTRFKEFAATTKQHKRNEESAEHLMATWNKRVLRRHYHAFCAFTHLHKVARRYWKRVFQNYDQSQKQQAIKQWRVNAHDKQLSDFKQMQNNTSDVIDVKNKQIGEHEQTSNSLNKHVDDLETAMKKKAHKQLGNYLQRYYSETTASRFKWWKDWVSLEQHKAKVMKSMILHLRKHLFTAFRNSCKTHISKEKQSDRRQRIRKQLVMCEEHEQSISNNQDLATENRKQRKAEMVRSQRKVEVTDGKITRAVDAMSRRALMLVYVSRKRMIFESWRVAVKQQKAFLLCVINVLEKSMWMKGFHHIKASTSEDKVNSIKYRHINMFILRFVKRNVGDYFNKWKTGALSRVDGHTKDVQRDHYDTKQAFQDQIDRTKKQNCQNVLHHFKKGKLKAMFRGWKKHKNYLKKLHSQQRDIAECLPVVFQRRAILKWRARAETTKRVRFNFQTMVRNKNLRLKKLVWKGILARRSITARLSTSISNLEKLMRDKSYMDAFKIVKTYSISQKLVHSNQKGKAKEDIASMLTQAYLRRLRVYFGRYAKIAKEKKYNGHQVKKIMQNVACHNLRWAFEQWRKQNALVMLAEEQNQTGPITEEVFEGNRSIINLKGFMRDQHFTEDEIIAYCKKVFKKGENQMNWVVKRLQQPKSDRYMQRCFDQWVFWIKVKRIMKYHLRFCNNQVKPVKCDIQWAFDHWRKGDAYFGANLARKDFKYLQVKAIAQSKALDSLADQEAESSAIINHLGTQRDELLGHCVRGQKLALSILRDSVRRSRGGAFNIWKTHMKHSRHADGTAFVHDSVNSITGVKSNIAKLETQNHDLVLENDHLRKFSMDGFHIAKNVQSLSNEREKLSVDLADKTSVIRKLLEENDRLKQSLAALGVHGQDDLGKRKEQEKWHKMKNPVNLR